MTAFLIFAILLLAVIVLGQIVRISEIAKDIRKIENVEGITPQDNNTQGKLLLMFMVAFMVFTIYSLLKWGPLTLPEAFSTHGENYDNLMTITLVLIFIVFFITQPVLFWFSYKYRGKQEQKATYISHSNKLETIWTVIPAITLTVLISYGLYTWAQITGDLAEDEDPIVIEVYAKQFNWTARYAGSDNVLGKANVRYVDGANSVGVDMNDSYAKDDKLTTEIHLPVGKQVLFKFRSQDVIHSAYMPHFRAQMNCVPGTITQFKFTPTETTLAARKKEEVKELVMKTNQIRKENGEDPYEFNYLLLCAKICGAAHYNMQMNIVVESEKEYQTWLASQKTIKELIAL